MNHTYYSNERFPEDERRNNAFNVVRIIRDVVTIARRSPQPLTYERAFDMLADLDPITYKEVVPLLNSKNKSEMVRYYEQRAKLESVGMFNYEPQTLIQRDIDEHEKLLKNANQADIDAKLIRSKINEFKAALEYFTPRKISEHKILNRDYNLKPKHPYFEVKLYAENDFYKDYSLGPQKSLRLRLLHPDKEEHIIGADLIYEYFDLMEEKVRFIHLQYKTWDEQTLYLNSGNIKDQINKLQKNVCQANFCLSQTGNKHSDNFRLPHCAAFFRPTDKIQHADSSLMSKGDHIPVCAMVKILESNIKLTKQNKKGNCISSDHFMDLFINNMLGSRWVRISALEKYYEERDIPAMTNIVRVHAQEIQDYSEEIKSNRVGNSNY